MSISCNKAHVARSRIILDYSLFPQRGVGWLGNKQASMSLLERISPAWRMKMVTLFMHEDRFISELAHKEA